MKVGIYKNCYNDETFQETNVHVINFDNRVNTSPNLWEYPPLFKLFEEKQYQQYDVCGVFSPKFELKTHVKFSAFHDWVQANPGYDFYHLNPFPLANTTFYNVWQEGEFWHRGLISYAQSLFDQCGLSCSIIDFPRGTSTYTSHCNYWVASPKFWESYIPLIKKLLDSAMKMESEQTGAIYHGGHVPHWVFVLERMVTTFIQELHPSFKILSYQYPESDFKSLAQSEREWGWYTIMKSGVDFVDQHYQDKAETRPLAKNLIRSLLEHSNAIVLSMDLSEQSRFYTK